MDAMILPNASSFIDGSLDTITFQCLHRCILGCIDFVLVGRDPGFRFDNHDLLEVVCTDAGSPQSGKTETYLSSRVTRKIETSSLPSARDDDGAANLSLSIGYLSELGNVEESCLFGY